VCIHVTTPAQSRSSFASLKQRRMEAASTSVGLRTTLNGRRPEALSASTICRECSATSWSVASP